MIARRFAPEPGAPSRGAGVWRRRLVAAAGPLALAAAMIVYVASRTGPRAPDLPDYTVTAVGARATRGPAEPSARLRLADGPDGHFEILMRPATSPRETVVAYAFAVEAPGSEAVALDVSAEVSPEGAVRLSGRSRALDGAREVRIVVGAPEAIGRFDDAVARATSAKSDPRARTVIVPIDR